MCGRFAQFSVLETLRQHFPIDTVDCEVSSSYNVAPSQEILTIARQDRYRLGKRHWGLVPFWAKDLSGASRMINARAETAAAKPSFRHAFKHRRCLIIADGFYEWKKEADRKQPFFMALASGEPFAFAGLWETWQKKDDTAYESCTILTIESEGFASQLHHRMPVILPPDTHSTWLAPENKDIPTLEALIHDRHLRELTGYPVSTFVNSPKNNTPKCIEPMERSANA